MIVPRNDSGENIEKENKLVIFKEKIQFSFKAHLCLATELVTEKSYDQKYPKIFKKNIVFELTGEVNASIEYYLQKVDSIRQLSITKDVDVKLDIFR